jgi:hypothetical protein
MTRDEALAKLEEPLFDPDELETDIAYFCKKLQVNRHEFNELMAAPVHHYSDFPNWNWKHRMLKKTQSFVERTTERKKNIYS